jgi:membrane protease YdiL (CAAX protease family)
MPLVTVFDLVLLGVGFGQEIGWRGFALPRLQRRFGPLGGALLVAVAWGAWLLPLAVLHGPPRGREDLLAVERLVLAALLVPSASVVLAFVLARTRGSIPAAALWHGSLRMVTATTGAKGPVEEAVFWTVLLGAAVIVALELGRRGTGRTLLEPLPGDA